MHIQTAGRLIRTPDSGAIDTVSKASGTDIPYRIMNKVEASSKVEPSKVRIKLKPFNQK